MQTISSSALIQNETNTFPASQVVAGKLFTYHKESNLLLVQNTGSGSGLPPATEGLREGDILIDPGFAFSGIISRIVDGNFVQIDRIHGRTDVDREMRVVRHAAGFRSVTWSVTSGTATINGVNYAAGSSYGGEGYPNNPPVVIVVAPAGAVVLNGVN